MERRPPVLLGRAAERETLHRLLGAVWRFASRSWVELYKRGDTLTRVDLDVETPRAYGVEARIGGRLWLLSNPVHLRSPSFRPVADAASSSSPS